MFGFASRIFIHINSLKIFYDKIKNLIRINNINKNDK